MDAQANQAQSGLERCWRAANRQMQSCSYGAKIKSVSKAWTFTLDLADRETTPPLRHYLLNSFRVLRSSTTYAMEARMPSPERMGSRLISESSLEKFKSVGAAPVISRAPRLNVRSCIAH